MGKNEIILSGGVIAPLVLFAGHDLERGEKSENILYYSFWRLIGTLVVALPFYFGLKFVDKLANRVKRE